jgi:hypothetical protein
VATVAGNYELELWKQQDSNVVGFVGPQFNDTYLSISGPGFTADVSAPLFGFQAGGQYTAATGNFKVSPWYQYTHLSGTVTTDVTAGCFSSSTSSSVQINSSSIGFDVLHVPSAMTLSSLYQQQSGGTLRCEPSSCNSPGASAKA